MHRTEGTNNAANLFTDGPPGTTVEESILNAFQEEIANVIEDAGISLQTASTDTRDQLLAAIDAKIAAIGSAGVAKNAIINGGIPVSQRETTFTAATTPANNDDTYLIDRCLNLSDGNDIIDVSQQTGGGVSGNEDYYRMDVETAQKKFGMFQIIEGNNCKNLIGEIVSLSFEAKVTNATKLSDIRAVVLAWDGAVDTVTSDIVSAWNVEGTRFTPVGNWTAENVDSNLGVTTSWVRYTINGISIDTASATNVGVFIYQNNVATNDTTGIFLEITNVQLENGSVATDFEYRLFGDELARCQRYYAKSYAYATAPKTATHVGAIYHSLTLVNNADYDMIMSVKFPQEMRTTPTMVAYDLAGNSGKCTMDAGDNKVCTVDSVGASGVKFNGGNGAVSTSRLMAVQYTAEIEL